MRDSKKHFVQLGVRISPEDHSDLVTFYQGYGMVTKVVRVLINRHLANLRRRELAAAQDLTALLTSEPITKEELASLRD
jgi:hypothetical protein